MNAPALDGPFAHAARVGRQLRTWATASVLVGAVALVVAPRLGGDLAPFVAGVAIQCLVWGAIDGAIAWFGGRDLRRRVAAGEPRDPAARAAFAARLQRLLRLNAYLDVGYVATGVVLLLAWRTPEGAGHAVGVLVQGGFLLAFDAWHGWVVPRRTAPEG